MNGNFIQDGTGRGYLARVDAFNRLDTVAVSTDNYVHSAQETRAFNVVAENVSLAATGAEIPIFYLKNNEAVTLALPAWFLALDAPAAAPVAGTNYPLARVWGNPVLTVPGTAVTPTNRSVGSPRVLVATAQGQTSPTSLAFTTSGTPVLYQTQVWGTRSFNAVNLFLPPGASVGVTLSIPAAVGALLVYTGFQTYLTGEDL
jgi:hypothetical protein